MQQHIVTNSVDTDQVEERTIDGHRHLVAKDVTFIQPQRLAGGYVPADHVASSAPEWEGQPLGVNHPRNEDGEVVSYNTRRGQQVVTGHARNPTKHSDGSVSADLAVNADQAEELGGEALDVVDALENGEPLEVSSQYFADPLPPGVYDGQHRDEVEGNLDPDGIALLPNKTGVCSLPDCGFDPSGVTANSAGLRVPVANADARDDPTGASSPGRDTDSTANATNYALTGVAPDDVDEWTDDEWNGDDVVAELPNPSEDDDAGDLLDATHAVHPTGEEARTDKSNWKLPFRAAPDSPVNTRALVAIAAALSGARGGVEGIGDNVREDVVEWADDMLAAAPADLFGARDGDEVSSNTLAELGRRVVDRLWPSTDSIETTGAESPAGPEANSDPAPDATDPATESEPDMERETIIEQITANSNIKRESLEGMGDQCLQSTHEHVVANSEGGDDDDETTTDSGGEDTLADMTVGELASALDEQGFVTEDDVGEAVANAQQRSEKEQRVDRIVANSSEYDEDDKETLLETPAGVLEDIEAGLSANATLPGATGAADRATANAAGGDDPSDYSDGTIGGDL